MERCPVDCAVLHRDFEGEQLIVVFSTPANQTDSMTRRRAGVDFSSSDASRVLPILGVTSCVMIVSFVEIGGCRTFHLLV